jgi:hypothetical protein
MQYRITLEAGIPKRQIMAGKTLVLLDTGVALELDMSIETLGGYAGEELRSVKRGLKFQADGITGAKFTASVDCVIEVVVSMANISVNYQENSTVNANILGTVPISVAATLPVSVALPLAVVPDRGAPANPVYVSGITYADAPAITLQDNAAVAVAAAAVALVAANPARRGLRFTNIGVDPVALGFTGITWANRCLILNAGDTWIEDRAANLAWAGICDADKNASVTVQEVMA